MRSVTLSVTVTGPEEALAQLARSLGATTLDVVAQPGAGQIPQAECPIRIDTGSRTVEADGDEIVTTKREFDLLLFLARHPGKAFTRQQIMDSVWGHQRSGERTVDVHVRRLRTKLGDWQHHVETVHGFGYRLAVGSVSIG